MTTFDDLLSGLLDRGGFRRARIPEICLEVLSQAGLTTAAAIDRLEPHSVILELNVPSYQSVSLDIEIRHRPFGLFFVGRRSAFGLMLPVGFHSLSYYCPIFGGTNRMGIVWELNPIVAPNSLHTK